jgi:AcrR family transcriptional regulator
MLTMEDKRKLLYDCAKELFGVKGFKDTNISEITQKAGVAVGTFYKYYPSKEKLFMDYLFWMKMSG